ncbi:hypothetical protein CLOP_g4007 [Closterium sp. NIES-67]|nr:hypothetical protein CLOP_g4007 [Closterium sp. NIES-67]
MSVSAAAANLMTLTHQLGERSFPTCSESGKWMVRPCAFSSSSGDCGTEIGQWGRGKRRKQRCAAVSGGGSSGGGGGGGDGIDKVRLLIGMATRDDKKRGFGPPPPKDKAAGSGLVNLTGREDLMAGRREFDLPFSSSTPPEALLAQARARTKARTTAQSRARQAEGSGDGEKLSDGEGNRQAGNEVREVDLEGSGSSSDTVSASSGINGSAFEHSSPTSTGLPLDLTPAEAVISAGMLALTVLAVGKGSRGFMSDDVIWLLQVWMGIAWTTHCSLGAFAAFICQQPGNQLPASSSSKWFVKISLAGFLAFSDFWRIWRQH